MDLSDDKKLVAALAALDSGEAHWASITLGGNPFVKMHATSTDRLATRKPGSKLQASDLGNRSAQSTRLQAQPEPSLAKADRSLRKLH